MRTFRALRLARQTSDNLRAAWRCAVQLSDDTVDDDDDEIGTVNDDDEIRIVVRRVKQNR